jgi:hypothetical protein
MLLKKLYNLLHTPKSNDFESLLKNKYNSIYDISPTYTTLQLENRRSLQKETMSEDDSSAIKTYLVNQVKKTSILHSLPNSTDVREPATKLSIQGDTYYMSNQGPIHYSNSNPATLSISPLYLFYSKQLSVIPSFSNPIYIAQEGSAGGSILSSFKNSVLIRTLYNHHLTNFYYETMDGASLYRSCKYFINSGVNTFYLITSAETEQEILPLLAELHTNINVKIEPIYIPTLDLFSYGLYAILLEKNNFYNYIYMMDPILSKVSYNNIQFLEVLLPFNFALSNLGKVSFCYTTNKQTYNTPNIMEYKND